MGVIGPAMLSLVTSQLAVDKGEPTRKPRSVANFELREAIAVTGVLKDLHTLCARLPDANRECNPF